ncbi:MAG TPA: hypothetical protein VMT21_10280 [Gemmatimonadales bacterium]|nr:hypothetical protein [Gemmatimonadales bacterium]
MYTTCAFCSGALGGDGGASGLRVGKRFAFDEWKSRAWVICQRCGRWNLTPLDTRLDAIGALERMAAQGRVAATTDQVALVRAGAYDVVRVGKPPRIEMAGWRYGERLKARERERLKVIIPVTAVAIGATVALNVAAGGSIGGFLWQAPNIGNQVYVWSVGNRKIGIEPPVCGHCGSVMVLRAKHVQHARFTHTTHQDLALLLRCPKCEHPGAILEGTDAELALRHGLTYVNLRKGRRIKRKAEEAASYVERHGGPEQLLADSARREIAISTLRGAEGLAMEMAVDEQAEVRDLEREWRRAEEIAEIADNLVVPPAIEQELKDLKDRRQPDG